MTGKNILGLTTAVGAVLAVLGVLAYALTGAASVTALIPTFVGVILLVCALLARRPGLRRHALHAAVAVAALGAAGSLMQVVKIGDVLAGTAARPAAVVVSTIMFVLLVVLVAAGVRSFVGARRARA